MRETASNYDVNTYSIIEENHTTDDISTQKMLNGNVLLVLVGSVTC